MPPQKNLTKKSLFNKKTLVISAVNSLNIQCKANNNLLNYEKRLPHIVNEKRCTITKFS